MRKLYKLCVNNVVGDISTNSQDFYRYVSSQEKKTQLIPPRKRRNVSGDKETGEELAEELNGQFTDVIDKNEYSLSPLLDRSSPFMTNTVVTKE